MTKNGATGRGEHQPVIRVRAIRDVCGVLCGGCGVRDVAPQAVSRCGALWFRARDAPPEAKRAVKAYRLDADNLFGKPGSFGVPRFNAGEEPKTRPTVPPLNIGRRNPAVAD